jgi:hypothetical protein
MAEPIAKDLNQNQNQVPVQPNGPKRLRTTRSGDLLSPWCSTHATRRRASGFKIRPEAGGIIALPQWQYGIQIGAGTRYPEGPKKINKRQCEEHTKKALKTITFIFKCLRYAHNLD